MFQEARRRSVRGVVPPNFSVRSSRLLARKGVQALGLYTTSALPAGFVIGQYRGRVISVEEATAKTRNRNFMFEVRRRGRVIHVIDGARRRQSSFVRFANAADWESQQNTAFVQFRGEIFLRTVRPVSAGSELLTWYGRSTAAIIAMR